jgi:hypothetical protein
MQPIHAACCREYPRPGSLRKVPQPQAPDGLRHARRQPTPASTCCAPAGSDDMWGCPLNRHAQPAQRCVCTIVHAYMLPVRMDLGIRRRGAHAHWLTDTAVTCSAESTETYIFLADVYCRRTRAWCSWPSGACGRNLSRRMTLRQARTRPASSREASRRWCRSQLLMAPKMLQATTSGGRCRSMSANSELSRRSAMVYQGWHTRL